MTTGSTCGALLALLSLTLLIGAQCSRIFSPAGAIAARRSLQQDPEPSIPTGWWQTLMIDDTYCHLRHFPALPNGYGTCNIMCPKPSTYDHQFLWRLLPNGANLTVIANVTTGVDYDLRIFNQMQSYIDFQSRDLVRAGVNVARRQTVQVIRQGGVSGAVNLANETFHLMSRGKYCRVRGSGKNALMYCDTTDMDSASGFKMPFTSFWGVNFTNLAVNAPCGAYFIPINGADIPYVNCTNTTFFGSNYKKTFSFTLKTPGEAVIRAGTTFGLKVHDTLYRYMISNVVVDTSTPYNATFPDSRSMSANQWLILDVMNKTMGTPVTSGDTVMFKSEVTGRYCGIGPSPTNQLRCDELTLPPSNPRYQFKISF